MNNWIHVKSGNVYEVISDEVLDATNGRSHALTVIYKRAGNEHIGLYCRDKVEFMKKFKHINTQLKDF